MTTNSMHTAAAGHHAHKHAVNFPKAFFIMGLLGTVLHVSGCYTVGTPGAPVQQREILSQGEPLSHPQDAESDVIVTPYPSGATNSRRLPEGDDAVIPRAQTPQAAPPNTAVVALLDSANKQSRSGKLDGAAAALERALRIDPRNAEIWHRLASVRLQQGQFGLASSLAAKSTNLAGNDAELVESNRAIMDQAKRAQR
ncbi:MAG: tetratricopeptide repeat protein [Gammaproteobacteria bacterium]